LGGGKGGLTLEDEVSFIPIEKCFKETYVVHTWGDHIQTDGFEKPALWISKLRQRVTQPSHLGQVLCWEKDRIWPSPLSSTKLQPQKSRRQKGSRKLKASSPSYHHTHSLAQHEHMPGQHSVNYSIKLGLSSETQ
jgi:hypothetical protein